MSIDLNVGLDLANLRRFRGLLRANKLIAAQSLTFVAERAQGAWRAGQSIFHRRNSWIDQGVRIKHATPGDLNARVGTIDTFLGRHIIGIREKKRAASGKLFVPVQPVEEQGTHTRIRARLRQMARTKTKPFVRNGLVMRRKGRGQHAPLVVLGALRKSVDITPRLDALGIVDRSVQQEYPRIYERLLLKWWGSRR